VLPDFSGHVLPGQQPRQMTASISALGTLLGVGGLLGVRDSRWPSMMRSPLLWCQTLEATKTEQLMFRSSTLDLLLIS